MIDQKIKLNYDDISIVPEVTTEIFSRSQCNPYEKHGMLPIFASPMGSVVNDTNYTLFEANKINPVIPRTVKLVRRLELLVDCVYNRTQMKWKPFVAFSLEEAKQIFMNEKIDRDDLDMTDILKCIDYMEELKKKLSYDQASVNVCIDLANGHMRLLLDTIKVIKKKYGQHVIVMSGNIANPKSYVEYDKVGCDYVRLSIGTGSACLTASNTGVYYPIFSLLQETDKIRKDINGKCKLIADGGIKVFRDIQKALIYADYVMIGGLLSKCVESAGETTYGKSWIKIGGWKVRNWLVDIFRYGRVVPENKYTKILKQIKEGKLEAWKKFYGMSTKLAQAATGNKARKTAEGIVKKNPVEYSIASWTENEESFLRSAMSYTNSYTLDEYKESQWVMETSVQHNR